MPVDAGTAIAMKRDGREPSPAGALSDVLTAGLFAWGCLSAQAPVRAYYVTVLAADFGLWFMAFMFTMLALMAVFGRGTAGPVARAVICALFALFFGWLTLAAIQANTEARIGLWEKLAIANLAFSKAAFVWSHRHSRGDEILNSFVPIILALICYFAGIVGYAVALMPEPNYHGPYWLYFGMIYFLVMAAEKQWPMRMQG